MVNSSLVRLLTFSVVLREVSMAGHSCPCGGTHVKAVGEIGGVTVTRIKKNKKAVKVSYVLA